MMLTHDKTERLLKKYGIHVPVTDERYLSHAEVERGAALRIACLVDPLGRKRLTVACQDFESSRFCPLKPEDAAAIVGELQERHLIPNHRHEKATLEHLVLRCSELFVGEDLERLSFVPVYLRENDYRVAGVEMTHHGGIDVKPRLDPGAHDKGAVFPYRPTARGRSIPKPPNNRT